MIEILEVRDALVFETLSLRFHPCLNVISGVSGSGKSVLLACILGSVGRAPVHAKTLEVSWKVPINHTITASKEKQTRYACDGAPISKKLLATRFNPHILHISSHKHTYELQSFFLLEILDSYLDQNLRLEFQEAYQGYLEACDRLTRLQQENQDIETRKEMVYFELSKLRALNLEEGAYARLETLKAQHRNKEERGERIQEGLQALENISIIHRALTSSSASVEFVQQLMQNLEDARQILLDEVFKLEELENIDMEALLDEMAKLGSVLRKYGSEAQARAQKEKLEKDYQHYCNHDDALQTAQNTMTRLENTCMQLGLQIRQARHEHLPAMQAMLEEYSVKLLLKNPMLRLEATNLSAHGLDNLQLSLNNSVSATLSAGEFNRLRLAILAIKAKRCQQDTSMQTILVDELDTNLSGQESACVANILKELSALYQVIAISHAPHLPSLADAHFLVYKDGENTRAKLLNKQEQILEIARMVDSNLGQEALAYARMKLECS
ncbi:DNA repair protein RecN [Helicobacter cynogastricus]|uniref:DNA repair protein n=1 Tax=Helicobacter cynogastricus TaxID=329937 RepID=UPI000CF18C66|nr:DNA repair protein [Helicobacter cynogastricus]